MKAILFFDSSIRIIPHSASEQEHIGKAVTIAKFSKGEPVGLFDRGDGVLLCKTQGYGRFIEGTKV